MLHFQPSVWKQGGEPSAIALELGHFVFETQEPAFAYIDNAPYIARPIGEAEEIATRILGQHAAELERRRQWERRKTPRPNGVDRRHVVCEPSDL